MIAVCHKTYKTFKIFHKSRKHADWLLPGGDTVVKPPMWIICFASFEGFVM